MNQDKAKVAIIGSGISGLTASYYLQHKYDITLFEANDYIGGHTATKTVTVDEGTFNIDTGFIVFNDWTYPNFIRLLEQINVESLATDMGFSVSCDQTGLEYSGESFATLFAQKRNIFSLKHWRMLKDIVTFNNEAKARFEQNKLDESITLGEFIQELGLSDQFRDKYLIPMGAAIWSSGLQEMLQFPALYFVRFFKNHGLLNINDRPQWRVIKGGSNSYVEKLLAQLNITIKTSTPVTSIEQTEQGWSVITQYGGDTQTNQFQHIIFACHSDTAAKLLPTSASAQKALLAQLPYKSNEVVLHTDTSLLPRKRSTWSSWNYRLRTESTQQATLSYDMNILQRLDCETRFVVTLNDTQAIDPNKILGSYHYDHPVYNLGSLSAQQQRATINGIDNLWFCGAYWYAGFHEDGVRSALDVANGLGADIDIL